MVHNYFTAGNFTNHGMEKPVPELIDELINRAVKQQASDIHLEPLEKATRIRFRIDGLLQTAATIFKEKHEAMISRLKVLGGMDIAEKRVPQDGRLDMLCDGRKIDLRISVLPVINGEKAVIRILDRESALLPLKNLSFSPANLERYKKIYTAAHGIALVTGPTGSGKSTTLYATLNELNAETQNIITIEDPVEYKITGINQVAVNNRTGLTFARGLRAIIRQDPNIIMIGEIRDAETANIAVQAALTGHLVFSTLHTNTAAGAITRLLDMGVEGFLLSSAIRGVVGQRLVRKICPHCRQQYEAETWEKAYLRQPVAQTLILTKGTGCEYCHHTGYKGRLAIQEVLLITPGIVEQILHGADEHDVLQVAAGDGFMHLHHDGMEKVIAGYTSVAELMRVSDD